MTGPEHYSLAEEILGHTASMERGSIGERSCFAEAQVHAILAAVAALGGLDANEGPFGGSATGPLTDATSEVST